MNGLVTVIGGGGYIGSILTRKLLQEGLPVRVFDNFVYGENSLADIQNPNLQIVKGDICDIKALSQAISGAEAVVLLATIVGRRVDDMQPRFMREVNLLASSVALDAAIEHGVNRFVFASTDSVYGLQSGVMYETGTPAPVSLYSRLKLRMEEQVIRAKRRDFHPTAVRISTCYGVSPRMRFDLVINSLVRDAFVKKEIVVSAGEETRAFIHVEDAATGILSSLRAHVSLVSGEVFNLSAEGQELNLNQLVNITRQLIPDVSIKFLEEQAELTGYKLSCSKIAKVLDFTPRWTIKAGMEEVKSALQAGLFEDPYDKRYSNTL